MQEKSYSYDRTVHIRLRNCSNLHEDDIEDIISECIRLSNASECTRAMHYFEPHGLSSSSVLSESHLNIHISPEPNQRYVQLDISTCGEYTTPIKIVAYALDEFNPEDANIKYHYLGFDYKKELFPQNLEDFLEQVQQEQIIEKYYIADLRALPAHKQLKDEYRILLKRK